MRGRGAGGGGHLSSSLHRCAQALVLAAAGDGGVMGPSLAGLWPGIVGQTHTWVLRGRFGAGAGPSAAPKPCCRREMGCWDVATLGVLAVALVLL